MNVELLVHYWNVIIIGYLTGLTLTSMLYVPYRVARHKLKGIRLTLTIISCFLWPVSMPLALTWLIFKCLVVIPVVIIFRFFVHSFRLSEPGKERITEKTEDERETVPIKLDPKFMNMISEKRAEKKVYDPRIKLR